VRVDELLERSAERTPDKTALVCGSDRVSYRQVDERSNRLACALIAAGVEPGDRVAICLENSIEAVVSLFAVLKAGGVFFFVYPQVSADRLTRLLADSGAAALIVRPGRNDLVSSVPRGVLTMTCDDALDAHAAATAPLPTRRRGDDLAALVYTSGSTGRPKGVMLTHGNMTAAAASIRTYLENTSDDVILNVLPLAFTYGLGQVTTTFLAGATLVLERSFVYPGAILGTMARERVTGLPLVPTLATLLLQQDLKKHRFTNLRYITNAAAALSTSKIQRLRSAFPGTRIYSMYGLTECQRVSYLPPDQIDSRPTSVGIAIPNTETYIVDECGDRVGPGTVGELIVRGPHIMKGYWNQPDASSMVLRPGRRPGEQVLHTGDLFKMDEEGFLYFIERKDDMIKTRGEKVAPREIEETIARLPGVAEVAVYGRPDDLLGEAIVAAITLTPGALVTSDCVRRHCLEHLEPFMVPTVVDIRDTVPTTMTGKVSRRALQAMAASSGGACA
jgi:long-chain acyl-CoA synthetase